MNRTALLEDPQLRPFLPLLWVAWSHGDLEDEELQDLHTKVEAMPWLRPAARIALSAWLDPSSPPSSADLEQLLATIERVAATLSPERRHRLVDLGAALATEVGGAEVQEALSTLESSVGVTAGTPAPGAGRPRDVDHAAPFDPAALKVVLDGPHAKTRDEVRRFLDDPELRAYGAAGSGVSRQGRGAGSRSSPRRRSARSRTPASPRKQKDLGAFIAAFETLAAGDLSLVIRYGVQFGLFGGSIYFLGTEAQRKTYLPDAATLALPGCFAMSEVGHGSDVANLETTVTWNPQNRTFVLHTPRESARKDWIGGAAQHAHMATVFAQLEANGERQGVHAFVVPIRNAAGETLPGVTAGDVGHKMGLNGVDNGRLWFDQVSLPEHAMLGRFASFDAEGKYRSPIANSNKRFFTMLGTLIGGRVLDRVGRGRGVPRRPRDRDPLRDDPPTIRRERQHGSAAPRVSHARSEAPPAPRAHVRPRLRGRRAPGALRGVDALARESGRHPRARGARPPG